MTDIQPPETGPSYRKRPWLRILLFVSLALNLAVAGLFIGMAFDGPPRPSKGGGADFVIPYTRALDEGQRKAVFRDLRQDFRKDKARKALPGVIADYRDALAILTTEPFDEAALMAVLERQTTRAMERQVTGQRVLGSYLASLPPEGRAAYAARLAGEIEHLEKHERRWKDRD